MAIFDSQLTVPASVITPPAHAPIGLPAPSAITNADLIGITISNLSIDTRGFISSNTDSRDTLVVVVLGGQSTTLSLSGGGAVSLDQKYRDKMLYLGVAKSSLDIQLTVSESRDGIRNALSKASSFLAEASSFLPSTLPAPVSPAIGLFAQFLSFVSSQIKDALEATLYRQVNPLGLVSGTTVRTQVLKNGQLVADITLVVNKVAVSPLQAGAKKTYAVSVGKPAFIAAPAGATPIHSSNVVHEGSKSGSAGGAYILGDAADKTSQQLLASFTQFVFEASSGSTTKPYGSPLNGNQIIPRLDWEYMTLFEVPVSQFDTIPISLSFALTTDSIDVSSYTNLLSKAGSLATAAGAPSGNVGTITKAAPSVLNFLVEMSQDNLSLYSFNGALLLLAAGVAPAAMPPGQVALAQAPGGGRWTGSISKQVTWPQQGGPVTLGALTFNLEVTAVQS